LLFRFSLRVNVGDFHSEAPFLLLDLIVERFAPQTYKLLIDMVILSYLVVCFGLI